MSFVFYDTETTGIDTDFDQILQFAAIKTDNDFNEVDRIEVRCRLLPHVIPHPGALRVTKQKIGDLINPTVRSHYEMIRLVREKFIAWSPSIFIGYNSLNFDEHLFRQALFQTLHPPYLTNTEGNCRADVMPLVQAAHALAPGCVAVPTDDKGRSVFKLDRLAPANDFAHDKAHDALGDVLATIHMARRVRENAPEVWSRFIRFAKKATASDFVVGEAAFLLTEAYFNKPYHYAVACFGQDPEQSNVLLCLDLQNDPADVREMSDADLKRLAVKSPKQIRRIRTNAAPHMATLDEVSPELFAPFDSEILISRGQALQDDTELCDRLVQAVADTKEEKEVSVHIEQQIYDGFIGPMDEQRMAAFHDAPWDGRGVIVDSFDDHRLRYFGWRLIHQEKPDLVPPPQRASIDSAIASKLVAVEKSGGKWTTIQEALAATEEMLTGATPDEIEILAPFLEHLLERRASLGLE